MKKVHAPLKKAKQTSRWYLFKCLSYWVPTIWHLIKKALRLTSSAIYAGWYLVQKTYICQKIRLMPDVWFVCRICFLATIAVSISWVPPNSRLRVPIGTSDAVPTQKDLWWSLQMIWVPKMPKRLTSRLSECLILNRYWFGTL